jgi:hypothetical protein
MLVVGAPSLMIVAVVDARLLAERKHNADSAHRP